MRFGLIGAGGMGRHQAATLSHIPNAACVALTDVDLSPQAQDFAEHVGAQIMPSAEALLARNDIDAVIIATPTSSHAALGIAAAQSGKHVFVEKPIARSLDEAKALINEAERAKVRLAVGHVVRYFPDYASTRQLIRDGQIGSPGIARAIRLTGQPKAPWYADRAASGGVILDVMIHDFDWMRWALGPVSRVTAHGTSNSQASCDAAMAVLRFESGAIGYVEGSWCYRTFQTMLEVSGNAGLLRTNNSITSSAFQLAAPERTPTQWGDGLEVGPYLSQMQDVVAFFAGGPALRHTPEDGLQALRLALAAIESVSTGEPVVLSDLELKHSPNTHT